MKKFIVSFIMLLVFGIAGLANADLIVRGTDSLGNKLIYDDDLDITWYDYTKSYETWDDMVLWAGLLTISYAGSTLDDWRLPATVDGPFEWGYDGTTTGGYNISSSEMGHLYYEELGNLARYDTSGDPQSGWGLQNTGDFDNLIASGYWSGTEYAGIPGVAWDFSMGTGVHDFDNGYDFYGLAVRSGDVSAVPIPGGIYLLGTGLISFAGIRRFKKYLI